VVLQCITREECILGKEVLVGVEIVEVGTTDIVVLIREDDAEYKVENLAATYIVVCSIILKNNAGSVVGPQVLLFCFQPWSLGLKSSAGSD
jgi:hypothetical protein